MIGAGGIGCAVIPALAGAGIGQLTIIDDDVVELANLHRQPLFGEDDAGAVQGANWRRLRAALNRFVDVARRARAGRPRQRRASCSPAMTWSSTAATISRRGWRSAMRCVALGVPLLSAAAVQFQGQVALFRARPCYRCFVGDAFDAEDCDNCAELGVLGALTGAVGRFRRAARHPARSSAWVATRPDRSICSTASGCRWRTIRHPARPRVPDLRSA